LEKAGDLDSIFTILAISFVLQVKSIFFIPPKYKTTQNKESSN